VTTKNLRDNLTLRVHSRHASKHSFDEKKIECSFVDNFYVFQGKQLNSFSEAHIKLVTATDEAVKKISL
jgi:hypothetical protein